MMLMAAQGGWREREVVEGGGGRMKGEGGRLEGGGGGRRREGGRILQKNKQV